MSDLQFSPIGATERDRLRAIAAERADAWILAGDDDISDADLMADVASRCEQLEAALADIASICIMMRGSDRLLTKAGALGITDRILAIANSARPAAPALSGGAA